MCATDFVMSSFVVVRCCMLITVIKKVRFIHNVNGDKIKKNVKIIIRCYSPSRRLHVSVMLSCINFL